MSGWLDRDVEDVIAFAKKEMRNPSQSWRMLCQSFCRQAYGVPVWAPLDWAGMPVGLVTVKVPV